MSVQYLVRGQFSLAQLCPPLTLSVCAAISPSFPDGDAQRLKIECRDRLSTPHVSAKFPYPAQPQPPPNEEETLELPTLRRRTVIVYFSAFSRESLESSPGLVKRVCNPCDKAGRWPPAFVRGWQRKPTRRLPVVFYPTRCSLGALSPSRPGSPFPPSYLVFKTKQSFFSSAVGDPRLAGLI